VSRYRNRPKSIWDRLKPHKKYYAIAIIAVILVASLYVLWPRSENPNNNHNKPPQTTAVIVDSFYNETPQFTDNAAQFLKSKGINVDVYSGLNVTVDLYSRLPSMGYKLVILRVHSGILGIDTFLFTNEPYRTNGYVTEQLLGEIQMGVLNSSNRENPVFAAGPLFVLASTEGRFNDSIVVLSSCLGLASNHLADAFIQRGASAFISWDEKVGLDHTDEAVTVFLKGLVGENMTVGQAVEKVMADVHSDPTYGSLFEYYPAKAGNITLSS